MFTAKWTGHVIKFHWIQQKMHTNGRLSRDKQLLAKFASKSWHIHVTHTYDPFQCNRRIRQELIDC